MLGLSGALFKVNALPRERFSSVLPGPNRMCGDMFLEAESMRSRWGVYWVFNLSPTMGALVDWPTWSVSASGRLQRVSVAVCSARTTWGSWGCASCSCSSGRSGLRCPPRWGPGCWSSWSRRPGSRWAGGSARAAQGVREVGWASLPVGAGIRTRMYKSRKRDVDVA